MIVNGLSRLHMTRRRDSECPINLTKWRAWFTDEDGGGQGEGATGGQSGTNGKTPIETLPPDVQEYIKELRAEAKTARENRKTLQEQIDTMRAAQNKQLEEQGNFKALHEQASVKIAQLEPAVQRLEEIEKTIRKDNEVRIATIPDSKKPLIQPLIDVLSPEKLQAYLNANPSLFVKEPAPSFDGGKGSGGGSGERQVQVTDEDKRQAAAANAMGHKITAEDIAKRRLAMAQATKDANQ